MKTKSLYILWGMLYVLCTLLGFIPNPTGFLRGLMLFFSAVFYFPGFILIHTAHQQNNKKGLRTRSHKYEIQLEAPYFLPSHLDLLPRRQGEGLFITPHS